MASTPAALVKAGAYDPVKEAPSAIRGYLQGGAAPGTFGRDLRTAGNQIPRWGWGGLAVLFAGMSWWSWKRSKPDKKKVAGTTP